MDPPSENDSTPSNHSLLDRLRIEVCADSRDAASNLRKLTINAPRHRNYSHREQSHDIDKEITDLENLIKRLQVEINQMSINASKPLKDYVLADDSNCSELKKDVMTYPVLNSRITSTSGHELDDVRRTFKLLWDDTISATTSDTPELNLINEQDEDVEDESLKNIEDNDSSNLNIHILRDYIAAKKNNAIVPPTFPPVENIANEFENNMDAIEIIPKVETSSKNVPKTHNEVKPETPNQVKPKAPDDNKPATSINTKPDSTIRLGILMHIFGDKSDDKKSDVIKPLNASTKSDVKSNVTQNLTDTIKSDSISTPGTDNKSPKVDLDQPKGVSVSQETETGSSLNISSSANTIITASKSNELNSSNPKILDKVSPDTKVDISKNISKKDSPQRTVDISKSVPDKNSPHPTVDVSKSVPDKSSPHITADISKSIPDKKGPDITVDVTKNIPVTDSHIATVDIPQSNLDDSRTNEKHREKHLRRQDKPNETNIKPCLADDNKVPIDSTTNSTTKKDDTSDIKKPNTRHSAQTKYPTSRVSKTKNISIKHSTEGLSKQDFKTLQEINKTYDSNSDVPQRLSIINIYLDSKKPKSNVIIHKKPKGHGRACSPSNALQSVAAKQRSDANISNFINTNQSDDPCDNAINIAKTLSQDFKTPSNENSLTSERIEISESMKKAYQNKCLTNASLRSSDLNPRVNSNPKLLDNDLSKSVMSNISQSNKSGLREITEISAIKDTKDVDSKDANITLNNKPNDVPEDLVPINVILDSKKKGIPENAPLTNKVSPVKPIQNIVTDLNNTVLSHIPDSPKPLENIVVNESQIPASENKEPIMTKENTVKPSKPSDNESRGESEKNIAADIDKTVPSDSVAPKTVEVIVIGTSEAPSAEASLKQIPNVITKPTPETSIEPSKALISEISVLSSTPEPKIEQSTDSRDISKETSTLEPSLLSYKSPALSESVSSKQTETDLSFKKAEDVQHKITSTSVAISENISELGNKSIESYETGDMTDEYESLADDNDSYTDVSMANEPQIIIQKTEITINNGDNFADAVEDSRDIIREASQEIKHSRRKK